MMRSRTNGMGNLHLKKKCSESLAVRQTHSQSMSEISNKNKMVRSKWNSHACQQMTIVPIPVNELFIAKTNTSTTKAHTQSTHRYIYICIVNTYEMYTRTNSLSNVWSIYKTINWQLPTLFVHMFCYASGVKENE